MREKSKGDEFPLGLPIMHSELKPQLRHVGKARRANKSETDANPRARSAMLRVAEKL